MGSLSGRSEALSRSDSFVEDMGFCLSPPAAETIAPSHRESAASEARSRFEEDFEFVSVIGAGNFGRVLRCKSRLDGCEYAVKSTNNHFRGARDKSRMMTEVHALAHLCATTESPHIVR